MLVEGELVDALWREERVIVEADGYEFHKSRARFEADRRRDAKLLLAGYRVCASPSGASPSAPRR